MTANAARRNFWKQTSHPEKQFPVLLPLHFTLLPSTVSCGGSGLLFRDICYPFPPPFIHSFMHSTDICWALTVCQVPGPWTHKMYKAVLALLSHPSWWLLSFSFLCPLLGLRDTVQSSLVKWGRLIWPCCFEPETPCAAGSCPFASSQLPSCRPGRSWERVVWPLVPKKTGCIPVSNSGPCFPLFFFFSFFWYIYWLCYYSCPISAPSLDSILPNPSLPHSPPIVHVHGSYL